MAESDCLDPASPTGPLPQGGATLADEDPVHGTINGYNNHHCRCDKCKNAWRIHQAGERVRRRERLKADPSIVPHGRASTYGNWGCRCRPCTTAWAKALQSRKEKNDHPNT